MSQQQVVLAGLDVLDAVGLDRLTVRLVAAELGVQVNTLYWHTRSKSHLLDLMADELISGCTDRPLPTDWQDRVRVLGGRYRSALLARRDGGRLSIARSAPLPNSLLLIEEVHRAFVDSGLPHQLAAHAAWQLSFLTLASAIEQQGPAASETARDLDESWPALVRDDSLGAALRYSISLEHDDRFRIGVDLLLAGFTSSRHTWDRP